MDAHLKEVDPSVTLAGWVVILFILFGLYMMIWRVAVGDPVEVYSDTYGTCMYGPKGYESTAKKLKKPGPLEYYNLPLDCHRVAETAQRSVMPWPFGH